MTEAAKLAEWQFSDSISGKPDWERIAEALSARSHALPKRCTCYVLPHADDCGLFMGITQSGGRVYASETPRTDEFESRIVSGDETHAPLVKPLTNQIDYCAAYGEAIEEMGRMEIELADALAKAQAAETTPSTTPRIEHPGLGAATEPCSLVDAKAPTAEAEDARQGTFACSVCGVDTPHWHDIDAVNRERVIERVVRPAFEKAYAELALVFPDVRVNGWGSGFQRRQQKDAPDPATNPSIIPGWYDRWTDDSLAPLKGHYKNPVIQALWRLWLRACEPAPFTPSATLQSEQLRSTAALALGNLATIRRFLPQTPEGDDLDAGAIVILRVLEEVLRRTDGGKATNG